MGTDVMRRKFVGRGTIDARGGLSSRGMPIPFWSKGNVYHVDSGHANTSDSNEGTDPSRPLATIDAAVAKCTANNGDIILVSEGHAETINTAAAIDLDVAGITVVGLGTGESRPTVTVGSDETGTTVEIGAADVRIVNLLFKVGVDSLAVLLDVNADDATIEDCEFRSDEGGTKRQALSYIDINGGGANAADRCTVRRCKITSITAGANQAVEIGAVEDGIVIEDNVIDGDWANGGLHSGSIFTNAVVSRNVIANRQTGDHAIEFTAACTGFLVDNRLYGDTLGTILDPGSLKCLGNLETDAVDQAGVDSPRTSAGGLADDSITAAAIATGAIDADAIAANAITAAKIATDAITAAKIADAAIDAATFAADALQAIQDEAEDALEGENLDHLAAVTTVAADMTAEVVDGSIISRILSKTSDTSTYDPTTDALEMASDKLGGFSGDGGAAQDDSVKASLDLAHTDLNTLVAGIENCVEKSDGAVLNGADDLFTITAGPVKAQIYGIVTTEIEAGAVTGKLQITTLAPAATTDLSTAVNIETDAVGTSYRFVGATGVLTPETNGAKIIDPVTVEDCWFLLPEGTVKFLGSAAKTGNIKWYMRYKPLSPNSSVVAAA